MVKHEAGRPRRVFSLEPLRPSLLKEIVSWCSVSGAGKGDLPDEDALLRRMYTEFRRQYRPLWSSGNVDTLVMTMNRVPVFCISVLQLDDPHLSLQQDRRVAHIYLLYCSEVRDSERLLLLAWHAATVHAFLRMGFSMVQAAVGAEMQEENEALLTLGYRLEETVSETAGRMNVYTCVKEEMRVVM